MTKEELLNSWLEEERKAKITGWDFSHIKNEYEEEDDLPWDYFKIVEEYLTPKSRLLDIDTGGGEFLLTLDHPYDLTSASEGYEPNIELCKEKLLPLGIDFRGVDGTEKMPFKDNYFDLIIDRHGDYLVNEVYRMLKDKGIFITQQVGAENDRELVTLLFGKELPLPFPKQYLSIAEKELKDQGFKILKAQEIYRPIRFYSVKSLVWFAKIIEWEFPGFEVNKYKDNLFKAQKILEEKGKIEGRIHRYLLVGEKDGKI